MKVIRPSLDDVILMKRLVRERDGLLKGCYWCGEPFVSIEDATLEHIIPFADGGKHELDNCALACEKCNLANIPKTVKARTEAALLAKEYRARANRIANGGQEEPEIPEDCEPIIFARFSAINRERNGRPLDFSSASFLLKKIHANLHRPPPSKHQKHVFKGHFNRWQNIVSHQKPEHQPPIGYINPFQAPIP